VLPSVRHLDDGEAAVKPKPFRIIPCAEWKARPPKSRVLPVTKKPARTIFHHTASHHAELDANHSAESYAESCKYARSIQNFHMDHNGWIDSGHNFLVTRGGFVLEGRHRSIEMVRRGKMVVSAHCPGQNGQPGVEHEQVDPEDLTPIQWEASVWLHAWICKHCKIDPARIKGHRDYFATGCPGRLYADLPRLRKEVAKTLKPAPYEIHTTDKDGSEHWFAADKAELEEIHDRFVRRGQSKGYAVKRR
jgi:hypothetical protein